MSDIQNLSQAMRNRGFTLQQVTDLVVPLCKSEFQAGYKVCAQRVVQQLEDRIKRDVAVLQEHDLYRTPEEIVVSALEFIAEIKKNCEL